jgi:hypothetical protein
VLYYALTIFLSAFLLFLVQPLIGKLILPWFGGTPAVWTTCMLFFQVLLLLGYAYAHSIVNRSSRFQRRTHLAILLLSILLLACLTAAWKTPILPGESWKPRNSNYPTWKVIQLLAVSVGFPFWILSATGPLLQGWFSRSHSGASPYRLYALSNLGSLLALISYPFLVEPTFTLRTQGALWSLGYLIFVLCCALSSFQLMRSPTAPSNPLDETEIKLSRNETEFSQSLPSLGGRESERPSWGRNLLWLSLAACASIMLLATTNQICQEVAVIPFLWILPLCLYLLSFILCFESERWYSRRVFLLALILALILACGVLYKGVYAKLLFQILIYSIVLFTCCMICHGELVRLKPCSRYLTSFYLLVATGGALGGIFIGLAAPRIFKGYWEFHFGLWLACCLTLVVQLYDKSSWVYERHPWPSLVVLFALILLANTLVDKDFSDSLVTALQHALLAWQTWIAALAVATLAAIEQHKKLRLNRPWLSVSALSLALGVLAFVFISHARIFLADSVWVSRNFYGVLVVKEQDPDDPQEHLLRLRHGRITHGLQFQAADKRYLPTSYYGRKSGIGLALLNHPRRFTSAYTERGGLRIGIVGLGVGTLAAYAQAGDSLRYYEINPEVVRLSLGARPYFTYVQHCPAQVDVVLGDARISMERELDEQHPQSFDVLAIDAFNSDSIPVHLLTKEVMSLYLRHLRMPDGIVAIHVSNRYLDLKPVVWALADHFGLASAYVDTEAEAHGVWGSSWILLARNPGVLLQPEIAIATTPRNSTPTRLWTDDFSNLFQILKK